MKHFVEEKREKRAYIYPFYHQRVSQKDATFLPIWYQGKHTVLQVIAEGYYTVFGKNIP